MEPPAPATPLRVRVLTLVQQQQHEKEQEPQAASTTTPLVPAVPVVPTPSRSIQPLDQKKSTTTVVGVIPWQEYPVGGTNELDSSRAWNAWKAWKPSQSSLADCVSIVRVFLEHGMKSEAIQRFHEWTGWKFVVLEPQQFVTIVNLLDWIARAYVDVDDCESACQVYNYILGSANATTADADTLASPPFSLILAHWTRPHTVLATAGAVISPTLVKASTYSTDKGVPSPICTNSVAVELLHRLAPGIVMACQRLYTSCSPLPRAATAHVLSYQSIIWTSNSNDSRVPFHLSVCIHPTTHNVWVACHEAASASDASSASDANVHYGHRIVYLPRHMETWATMTALMRSTLPGPLRWKWDSVACQTTATMSDLQKIRLLHGLNYQLPAVVTVVVQADQKATNEPETGWTSIGIPTGGSFAVLMPSVTLAKPQPPPRWSCLQFIGTEPEYMWATALNGSHTLCLVQLNLVTGSVLRGPVPLTRADTVVPSVSFAPRMGWSAFWYESELYFVAQWFPLVVWHCRTRQPETVVVPQPLAVCTLVSIEISPCVSWWVSAGHSIQLSPSHVLALSAPAPDKTALTTLVESTAKKRKKKKPPVANPVVDATSVSIIAAAKQDTPINKTEPTKHVYLTLVKIAENPVGYQWVVWAAEPVSVHATSAFEPRPPDNKEYPMIPPRPEWMPALASRSTGFGTFVRSDMWRYPFSIRILYVSSECTLDTSEDETVMDCRSIVWETIQGIDGVSFPCLLSDRSVRWTHVSWASIVARLHHV